MPDYAFGLFLILVLVISALIGLGRGFVRSIAGLAEYIIAFFVANRFYTLGAELVVKIPFLAKLKTDVDMPELDSGVGFFEKLKAIIDHLISTALNSGDAEAYCCSLRPGFWLLTKSRFSTIFWKVMPSRDSILGLPLR